MVRVESKLQAELALNGRAVVLRPGLNEVPEDAWEKACEHKLTHWFLQEGIITAIPDAPPCQASEAAAPSPAAASSLPVGEHANPQPDHHEPASRPASSGEQPPSTDAASDPEPAPNGRRGRRRHGGR